VYPYVVVFGMGFYDILLVIAVVLSLFLADRMGIYRGFSVKLQKTLIFSIVVAVVCGLAGAVLFQSVYDWIDKGTFSLNSGMTFYGGLIFGVVFFLLAWFLLGKYYCKSDEAKKQFGNVADIAACIVPLAHGLGRLGCLTAGCCHGKATDAWYGITMHTEQGWQKVVPVQLFEAIVLFLLSAVLFWVFFKKFGKENKGRFPLLPTYAIGYGVWRFAIEYARGDDVGATIVSFLSPSQLIALLMVGAGIAYFCIWYYKKKKIITSTCEANTENNVEEQENGKERSN